MLAVLRVAFQCPASRRFFGGLKKKRSENGDVIFLTEADFKDR